ncbi:hypothetical protein ACIRBX_06980 [Kitasatospora sp. NPDC096147]|uniref:hypothetical protein n=1 Tax=Kitasatospora sp. NPDC096147 TaxID=3364093 RepID=UPI00382BD9B8
MSARGLVTGVAVVSALVLGLTGCQDKDGGSGKAAVAPADTASSAPVATPGAGTGAGGTASGTPKAGASKSPSAAASSATGEDPDAEACSTPAPKANWKYVQAVKPPKQDTLYVKDAKFVCDPNDGHYEGAGAEKTYMFATKVKAQISAGPGNTKVVPVGELWQHIGDCLVDRAQVKEPYSCSGGIYEIALDGTGKITEIREVWHP